MEKAQGEKKPGFWIVLGWFWGGLLGGCCFFLGDFVLRLVIFGSCFWWFLGGFLASSVVKL